MKTVLHIPSWFPNNKDHVSGIFVKKMIEAIALDSTYRHIVIVWHDSDFVSLKNPILFLRNLFSVITSPVIRIRNLKNITYVYLNVFQGSPRFFGDNDRRIFNIIKKYILSKFDFDLIHAHVSYIAGKWAYDISKRSRIPYLISEHMGPFPFKNLDDDIKESIKSTIKQSNCTIAVSRYQAKEIELFTEVVPVIIPNVVNEFEFVDRRADFKNEIFTFITVGLISEQKGIDLLLKAIAIVKKHYKKDVRLKVCGDGRILDSLKGLSRELGITESVIWVGSIARDQIIKELLSSEAYVCSSRHESFGIAPVEAMACGLPIVSTRCGGPNDYINVVNGILVNNEDVNDLAKGLSEMIDRYSEYDSQEIRNYYMTNFSSGVICEKYIKLYSTLVN